MSDQNEGLLHEEVERLRTLRDELRVQLHLAKNEARDRFESAEKSWHELEGRLKLIGRESQDSLHEVGEAANKLVDEIKQAYKHVRELV